MGARRSPREKMGGRKNKEIETDSWGSRQMEKNKGHRFNSSSGNDYGKRCILSLVLWELIDVD